MASKQDEVELKPRRLNPGPRRKFAKEKRLFEPPGKR